MYKVFINNAQLIFSTKKSPSLNNCDFQRIKYEKIKENFSRIFYFVDTLNTNIILIEAEDTEAAFKEFSAYFQLIIAGGAIVFNQEKEILMIFRRGYWDLPKGKIDEGESIKEGAIRELEEETAVKNPTGIRFFTKSYHMYALHDNIVLKETHWFLMQAEKQQELKAQEEEDIMKVEWMKLDDSRTKKTYASIQEILEQLKTS